MLDRPGGDRKLGSLQAAFHPESLIIETRTRASTLLRWLHDAREVEAAARRPMAIILSQIHHERDHLRRTLGTTHGLLMHAIRSRLILAFVQAFDAHAETSVAAPLIPLEGHWRIARSELELSTEQRALLAIEYALSALQDEVTPDPFRLAQSVLAQPLERCGDSVDDFRPLPPFLRSLSSGQPLSVNGTLRVLSGRHLLEFFALGEEINHIHQLLPNFRHILKLYERLEYAFVPAAWNTQFGEYPLANRVPENEVPGDPEIGSYRLFPIELYAAADLALWPPFTPHGYAGTRASVRWADIHPGCRFLAALAVLKDARTQMTEIPLDRDAQATILTHLQDSICLALGWPTPTSLAATWHEFLSNGGGGQEWPFLEGPGAFRTKASAALLSHRGIHPEDLVLNASGWESGEWAGEVGLIADADDDFTRRLLPEVRHATDGAALGSLGVFNVFRQIAFDLNPEGRLLVPFPTETREKALAAATAAYVGVGGGRREAFLDVASRALRLV